MSETRTYQSYDQVVPSSGWRQECPFAGLTLRTRGLKYSFQGIINAKSLRRNSVSPSDGGVSLRKRKRN